ncbi:hypothetical protein GLW05_13595 [Pontibacillus yanchengensis]|uniref:Uncharacterized protein n=1 Tax=Pontibacillus yanchengensis TaxID=462910 RepID=A0A6I5A165_9BACI|nr:hypothetical protein [Pontibacillus yanchengensis]MYL34627.1 hypothetical protein [Pontibacillus yanchengensis]
MFFPEAKDVSQVKFYMLIATQIYVFLAVVITFYILYKVAMLSNNKGFKNLFLFLMSLVLRIPFQSVEVTEYNKLSFRTVIKEVWKELLFFIIATIWFLGAMIVGYIQIQEFISH